MIRIKILLVLAIILVFLVIANSYAQSEIRDDNILRIEKIANLKGRTFNIPEGKTLLFCE